MPKAISNTLMLLLVLTLPAAPQTGDGSPKGSPPKPAWRWSVDERLSRRFDPEYRKARAEARAAKLNNIKKRFSALTDDLSAGELKSQQNVDTIEGETDPELFLTFELFDQLLEMGFPPDGMNQQESRRLIEERSVALGFGQDLWDRLERAAAPFLKLQRREEQLARNGLLPLRSEDGIKMSPEALHWCRERAKAIAAAKAEFGEEPFLRLLYSGVTPGFSITYVFDPGKAGRLRYLEVGCWPLGSISGTVRFKEKGIPLPKKILVKTLAVPGFLKRPATPKGAIDCPVDSKGAWSCSLPATAYDLVISAEGSTPVYRWGMKIPAGKTLSLGTIELSRGASVAGWVAVEEGRIEPRKCIARLDLAVAGGGDLRSVSTLQRTAVEREVARDGFFQFAGLAPGTYVLEVRQPGYPAVRSQPIRVDPGSETLLREPLVLQRPLAFQLDIRPPQDWLGRPWRAQVVRLGERPPLPIVFDGKADEEGRFAVSGQSAGRFEVMLLDSLGNRLYRGEHELNAASGPQPIEVSFVTVEGKIHLGTEPLAATLWFDGRSGANAVKMEADSEGKFHGVLSREGSWRIEVQASMPGFPTWARTDVQANRSGKATLDVALPDTRVFGRVVDEQGKPVSGADVTLQGGGLYALRVSDSEGKFEARGLSEGQVGLGAEAASRVSDLVFATLTEGREAGPIELRLHQTRRLTGTVTSPHGPVAGSRVVILARAPGGGGGVAMTDTEGTFRVDLAPTASRLVAVAGAPGLALRAFDTQAGDKPLLLPLTEEQGGLEINLPLTNDELLRDDLILVVFQNGLPIPRSALGQWARDHGQVLDGTTRVLRVPEVAPGAYRVCLLPQQLELMLPWSTVPEGPTCASGFLAPGATLALKPGKPG